MTPLRIVFMGTPELACASLRALLEVPLFQVAGVVTQPDRPKGRELHLQASPVKQLALAAAIPVLQPERARDERFIAQLQALQPDLIAVAAFGQLLPKTILDLPRFGCVNVHASLLPRYRGAAPIQWALLNDDRQTGVTIMKMDPGLDTGDILAQETTPIGPDDNAITLHERLARMGADLLTRTIPPYVAGGIQPRPQPSDGIAFAPKIKKEDGRLDWSQPARALWNRVRALVPWPGAFTHLPAQPQPLLLKIWEAEIIDGAGSAGEILQVGNAAIVVACGRQALRILALQREGGRRLTAQQFLAGHRLEPGQRLG